MGFKEIKEAAEQKAKQAIQGVKPLQGTFNPLGNVNSTLGKISDFGAAIKDRPEYLVQYGKGKEQPKLYAGNLEKDGSVKFSEISREQYEQLQRTGDVPPVQSLQSMTAALAQENIPNKLSGPLDILQRVDARLSASGIEHHTAADISLAVKKGDKPAAIASAMDGNRTAIIEGLEQELKDLDKLKKKQHPELEQIAEGSNPPITIRQSMEASIKGALEGLKPAEGLSSAVDGFNAQVVNAPTPTAAPVAPKPSLGNF